MLKNGDYELYVPWVPDLNRTITSVKVAYFGQFGYYDEMQLGDGIEGVPKGFMTVPVGNDKQQNMLFHYAGRALQYWISSNTSLGMSGTITRLNYPFFIRFEHVAELKIQPSALQIEHAKNCSGWTDIPVSQQPDEHAAMLRFFGTRSGNWNGFKKG